MNIETERLRLRPVSERDVDDIYRHFNEQVTRYMFPPAAKDRKEMQAAVHRFMTQWSSGTDAVFTVVRKGSEEFIGVAGLHGLKQEIPEIGIWTKLEAHGRHYGREAVGGLIGYARTLGLRVLCYPVDRRNIPSRKIPRFYGGQLTTSLQKVETPDGRMLEEEVYEIVL